MEIRKCTLSDAFVLSSLCADVQHLHAGHHPEIFKQPGSAGFAEAFFADQLADPLVHIFIAELDEQAVGYILCKWVERPENPFNYEDRFILIDQIAVRPGQQMRGVGAALIARSKELARELGARRIQLVTWDFNKNAHGFFEHEGFTCFSYRYWQTLE